MAFSEDQIVVIQSKIPDTIIFTTNNLDTVLLGDIPGTIVSESTNTIVSSNSSTHLVISQGAPGPIGLPGISEDEAVYSKRVDFINDYDLYRGEAAVGTSENSALWRIRKITMSPIDGDVGETWASGSALFDKVWIDRAMYIYI